MIVQWACDHFTWERGRKNLVGVFTNLVAGINIVFYVNCVLQL